MPRFLKIILVFVAAVIIGIAGLRMWTKRFSPAATATLTQGDLSIHVNYCQPAVKGRVIFGELVPYGQVWRTGANEATTIRFSRDVHIAGQPLKAGKYSLWTIPSPENWVIIFNSETGQWGTSHTESKDVLKVSVPPETKSATTELFHIGLSPGESNSMVMTLDWDKTRVTVPIE